MTITVAALFISAAGAIGGFVNSPLSGERYIFPKYDETLNLWRPGWIGNALIGGIAAVVIWMVYGPLAGFDLTGENIPKASVTLSQLGSSLVVGLSGGKVLTSLAQQKADRAAKSEMARAIKKLNKDR